MAFVIYLSTYLAMRSADYWEWSVPGAFMRSFFDGEEPSGFFTILYVGDLELERRGAASWHSHVAELLFAPARGFEEMAWVPGAVP